MATRCAARAASSFRQNNTQVNQMPLVKLKYRRYPKLIEAMANRHQMYNEELEYIRLKEKAGELLVIRPERSLEIKKVEKDPAVLRHVYDLGRAAGQERLAEIKAFLNG